MTAPVITHTISPPPNAHGWNNMPVTINWTIAKTLSGIGATTGCEPTTVSIETVGTTLTCSATSVAGNSASDSVVVKIDTTQPRLDTTVTPVLAAAGQNVQLSVVASEALAGPPAVNVSGSCVPTEGVLMTLGGNSLPPTYTGTYTVPAGPGDCSAAVNASATDLAGNAFTGSGAALAIDRTPPTLAVNASPRLAKAGDQVSIDVLSSESLGASPVGNLTANCLSGLPIVLSVAPASRSDHYVATFDVPTGATDCFATIVVDGTDRAGNQGSGSTQLGIDRTPPRLTTSVSPSLGRAGANISITVAASEDLGRAPAVTVTGVCVPDAALPMALNGGVYVGTYTVPDGSTNCAATVQATGVDFAGNPSVPGTGRAAFGVKRSQPVLTTTASPSPARAGTFLTVSIEAGADQLAQAPTVEVSGGCISSSSVSVRPVGTSTSYSGTYTVPAGSSDCLATILASGFDAASNPSTGGQTTFAIDRTPPTLRVGVSPNPVQPNGSATVSVDASEDLVSAPTVTLAAAAGCLPRDIQVSMSATDQMRRYSGIVSVPDIDGNCTARIMASGEDLAHNSSTGGGASLAIGPAMQVLRVSVNSQIPGNGNLTSSPAGIDCVAGSAGRCSLMVARHQSVTLVAQEGDKQVGFDNWKGSDVCSGADLICKVVMDADRYEVANFRQIVIYPAPSPTPTPTPTVIITAVGPQNPSVVGSTPGVPQLTVTTPVAATAGPSPSANATSASNPAPNRVPTTPPVPTRAAVPTQAPSVVPHP